jgi:hypothetical protein
MVYWNVTNVMIIVKEADMYKDGPMKRGSSAVQAPYVNQNNHGLMDHIRTPAAPTQFDQRKARQLICS